MCEKNESPASQGTNQASTEMSFDNFVREALQSAGVESPNEIPVVTVTDGEISVANLHVRKTRTAPPFDCLDTVQEIIK